MLSEKNIIREKVLAEKQAQHILYRDATDTGSALICKSKTRDKDESASDRVPRQRLRWNSPLRFELHLFPSNGSISGFEKVIWKHEHVRTHSHTGKRTHTQCRLS